MVRHALLRLEEDRRVAVRERRVADVVLESDLAARGLAVREDVELDSRRETDGAEEVVVGGRRHRAAQPGRPMLSERLRLEQRHAVEAIDVDKRGRVVELEVGLTVVLPEK